MFKKVLIANRGEIAIRVIRACREMGIIAASVFSEVDKKALHVRLADEAYLLGGASQAESYLHIDKIISIARECGAEAIHPGYGFLAENSEFVFRCEEEGIVFVGPSSKAMDIMGKKTTSRAKMMEAGIPIIPGTLQPIHDEKALVKEAEKLKFPVMLKAASGGGGKGLRLVNKSKDLASSFRLAMSEAKSSFDDPSVYLEKYIEEPHHIEIQILADHYGNIIYLGERECSIQRRYQKVLEETPSPFLDEATRHEMGRIAVKAASAVDYRNAGTVEFVVDRDKNFYFLEMNTRLQVEHPVTEMVTGIDLVKWQMKIAAGLPLTLKQEEIAPRGCSIQCRIYAEDPDQDFMPSPGKITHLRSPSGGIGVRYDNGIYEGYEVPLEYDPLLSKLITWGESREEAIQRMKRALSECQVYGIKTTIPFFMRILRHPHFLSGTYNTHFINTLEKEKDTEVTHEEIVALITAGVKTFIENKSRASSRNSRKMSNWKFQARLESLSRGL